MKVLIISHNVISTTNNMGKTLQSLFSEFRKEELCQLYIHPMLPDIDVCSSYYCISDEEVLCSIYKRQLPGHIIDKTQILKQKEDNKILPQEISNYARKNSASSIKRLLRDWIWSISKWDNEKLTQWLSEEKPTCIFLAPGYAKFIYDIALVISKKLDIPIITYICDDYYFVKEPKGILGRIQLKLLQKKMCQLFQKTEHLIAICEKIRTIYSNEFDLKSTVIMTGSNFKIEENIRAKNNPTSLSYFGNIRCNRNISLAEIGKALDEINQKNDKEYKLKIYTSEKDTGVLSVFEGISSIQMCGFVSGDKFEKEFVSADLLVHVEAFDEENMDLVKYSISTKIADSLGAGIGIVAYGPEGIASIDYLKNNKCAVVISESKHLCLRLEQIFEGDECIREIVENAMIIAKNNHVKSTNSMAVKKICETNNFEILHLDEIKEYEKQILLHFKKVCSENNIKYFLSNGTLLGAIKYKGFIPWDDDIDVFVPRKDYDILMAIYQDTEKYRLFSTERNLKYRYPFAKLCDMTTRKEEKNIDNGVRLGIDIDIFPLDSWPDNYDDAKKQAEKILYKIKILNYAKLEFNRGKSMIRTWIKTIFIIFAKCIGRKKLINQIQQIAKQNKKTSKYCGCVVWPIYGAKEIILENVFDEGIEVEFEGVKFSAPRGYDTYLRSIYGDYEKDLPLEMQKTHHTFRAYKL